MSSTAAPMPNVVFIISDHHRWDYMGCVGADFVRTPNLDALAGRGTVVSQTYCTAPVCVPSRVAITSGRYPMNTGCFSLWLPADPAMPTFLHSLQGQGIHTAMIGKFHHHVHLYGADFAGHAPDVHRLGYDHVHETSGKAGVGSNACECRYAKFLRGLGLLDEYRKWTGRRKKNEGTMKPNEPWKWGDDTTQDAYIAAKGCEFIRQAPTERPFYLHLGFVGPHPQFDAPERFRGQYQGIEPPLTIGDVPRDRERWLAYAACITEVDEKIGQVVAELETRGLLDNTVILYTSDHGDCAGDHGRWGKANLYEGSVHVPLIAAGAGVSGGRQVNAMAELIDVGRTVSDFMGCSSHHFDQGMSLKPPLTGTTDEHRRDVFVEMGSDKMLYDGRYKLMYGDVTRDTRSELRGAPHFGPAYGRPVNIPPDKISLYDLLEDPYEEDNLADDSAHAALLAEMKEKLLQRMIRNTQSVPLVPQE